MRSVERALEVLESIADLQPVGVSEIARHLGEPKSSVQRALDTLAEGRWITRQDPSRPLWVVAVRAALLGRGFAEQFGVGALALDQMERLRQITQETIHLAVPREASVILVERLESPHPVRYVEPLGGAASIFRTATGKAILAHLSTARRRRLVEAHPRELAEAEMTVEELEEELAQIRRQGFSTTSRWREEVFATASVVIGDDGQPVAAISISAPSSRVTPELREEYAGLVRAAGTEIGRLVRARERRSHA
ncbi:IclR family transcriptional regulator [Microbacterium resistens]|uniref:IclR family transcriptional regulator n=1 Tax=Microbacterium resistens TaxID=156977 RepID=A0ABY3RSD8_9MICO|nr:IclR family transcriptional regulator [Microbacterium resistens]UGS25631.1 IclR family transcriptional regulator [Microbacterium resistens]